ncbi:MAG: hypothetical protein JSR67_12595 [Proteobacteria bacterium]|nr:hypothetical protein [Pseudomonadota bacterium]
MDRPPAWSLQGDIRNRPVLKGRMAPLMALALLGASCSMMRSPGGPQESAPRRSESPGPAATQPAAPAIPAPVPPPPGEQPAPPPVRQYRLGNAAAALVAQARRQSGSGDVAGAAITLERAQRIEPDNPLVWIELGRLNMGEDNAGQAGAMGHKALSLATGDPATQALAWRLIADSLKARGRNQEAAEALRRAGGNTN